jgi:hypothetical protein
MYPSGISKAYSPGVVAVKLILDRQLPLFKLIHFDLLPDDFPDFE